MEHEQIYALWFGLEVVWLEPAYSMCVGWWRMSVRQRMAKCFTAPECWQAPIRWKWDKVDQSITEQYIQKKP